MIHPHQRRGVPTLGFTQVRFGHMLRRVGTPCARRSGHGTKAMIKTQNQPVDGA